MGNVVELMPRIRQRDYQRLWEDACEGRAGSIVRLRNLMALDADFRAFCEMKYREHLARVEARTVEDDGA